MWYVIWTKARNEHIMQQLMEKELPKGCYDECWMPMRVERFTRHGEQIDVEKKLFPGYLFVETDDPLRLHVAIKKVKSICSVMHNEDSFLAITQEEKKVLDKLTGKERKVGVSVGVIRDGVLHVTEGPLVGMEQYVVRIDRHKRKAWLEMELFGDIRRFNAALEVVEKE